MNRLESVEAFGTLFLIALALSTSVPWPQAQAAQARAPSQPLTTFTGTLCRPYSPPPFSIDLGSVNWCFSQTQISFADNWTPQHNFTFSIPTLAGLGLTITTSQNSSTIDYHLAKTFAGRTLSGDIFLKSLGYSQKITIKGTISGSASSFAIAIPFARVDSICDAGPLCNSVSFNHLTFSWADASGFSPTYNNATKVLTFTVGNSFSIDPIAIDTSGSCSHAGASNSCTTASITTTARNDLLLMFIWSSSPVPDCEAQTETSSPAMTWRERNNIGSPTGGFNSEFCEYYAQWDSAGAFTATCVQATSSKGGCFIIAISDAMIKPPSFDYGLCVNQRTLVTTTTTTITACPSTTYNKRDLLIGAIAVQAATSTITAGSGFTLVGCRQANLLSICVEDQFVSSIQTNTQATWIDVTSSGNTAWFLSDTVEEFKPDIVQTTSCTFTSSSAPTCAFASNLNAGDTVLAISVTKSSSVTVSSITDAQGLTYSNKVQKNTQTTSDVEAWMTCNTATAAADTITDNLGSATDGYIVLYELTALDVSCTVRSSTGSAASGAWSVASYTPLNASLVIAGGVCATTNLGVLAGSGYLRDNALFSASVSVSGNTEHATNNGTAETSPDNPSPCNSGWNEISMSFVRPTPNALITTSTTTSTTTTSPTTTTTTTTSTQTNNLVDPVNYDWLLLIPVAFVLFLVIRRLT